MKKIIVLISLILLNFILFSQETRGLIKKIKELDENATIGKQYAVLIAIDRYKYWQPLKNPVKDAKELKDILQKKYYVDECIELYNEDATKKGIFELFNNLISKVKPEDSLFIFYAGHGHLDTKLTKKGSWIPIDGGIDEIEQDKWIGNDLIRGMIDNINSKHILLVSDSCFSGDLLDSKRGLASPNTNDYFKKAYQKVSRQILTSGASETVSDDSDFARSLKTYLKYNNKSIVDPLNIFDEIRVESAKNSTPMFGFIPNSAHQEGGSFLFFLKEDPSLEYIAKLDAMDINNANKYKLEDYKKEIASIIKEVKDRNFTDVINKGEKIVKNIDTKLNSIFLDELYNELSIIKTNSNSIKELEDNLSQIKMLSAKAKERNLNEFLEKSNPVEKEIEKNIKNKKEIESAFNELDNETMNNEKLETKLNSELDKININEENINKIYNNILEVKKILNIAKNNSLNNIIKQSNNIISNLEINIKTKISLSIDTNYYLVLTNNQFDTMIKSNNEFLKYVGITSYTEIKNIIEEKNNKINSLKTDFENSKSRELDNIKLSNFSSYKIIEESQKRLTHIESLVQQTKSVFVILPRKIFDTKEVLSLNKKLIDIETDWNKKKKYKNGVAGSGAFFFTTGLLSTGACIAMWGAQAGLRNMYNSQYNNYMSGNFNYYSSEQIVSNAQTINVLYVSGIALIPVSVALLIPGIVLLGVTPNEKKYQKDRDYIKSKIKIYNVSLSGVDIMAGKDTFGFGVTFKLQD
ncbi:MAG: hypothetical protein A2086_12250 [Spirochaetes bacterium GWD1_27_9]|nr:MAG: hypothetical protein A2Z98_06650 [Spirochaetes bacterium GWB1_27_13]OHD26192.1 MAG: hypothetical protein A2Y34_09580 [Spirochaetes bacterium GWC1_27_15]OHD35751.1 MAG: hypothetical protein A2086_12250 [Spirochaetes bacterium GWD1_27_9]